MTDSDACTAPPASEAWIEGMADAMSMLANTKRMAILFHLLDRDLSVTELVKLSGSSFPAISQQLKLLTLTGILERRRVGRNIYYSLIDRNVHSILDLLRTFEPKPGRRDEDGASRLMAINAARLRRDATQDML